MESDDAIMAMARCSCGHGIGRHDENGCPGAQATFCVCTLTPSVALDAAIERVRYDSLARCHSVADPALFGTTFDADRLAAELNSDDYECVGPVRTVEPAVMISLLASRLVRAQ
jgi:hypothetical protein